jgi:hypothetical protein
MWGWQEGQAYARGNIKRELKKIIKSRRRAIGKKQKQNKKT